MPYTLLELFFAAFCGTDGSVPNCKGCNFNQLGKGCQHDQNPMVIMEKEVMVNAPTL